MEEIFNLKNYLANNLNDLEVLYMQPPSYIKRLVGLDDRIIFIYKSKNNYDSPNPHEHWSLNVGDNGNKIQQDVDLDLTGSPLKDECEIDTIDASWAVDIISKMWTLTEENFIPIDSKKSRNILNTINFNPLTNKIKAMECTIWILNDDKNVPLIGVHVKNGWNCRQIVRFNGLELPLKLNCLKMFEVHFKSTTQKRMVNVFVESTFNVTSNISLMVRQSKSSISNNLLKFSNDAEVAMYQKVIFKDNPLATKELWSELETLNEILHKINDNNCEDLKPDFEYDCDLDMEVLKKKIMVLLSGEIQEDLISAETDEYESLKSDKFENIVKSTMNRSCFEITHNLWNIMKKYTLGQLKIALTILFQCVAKLRTDIPVGKSRLSELISEVSKQRISIPCLSGTEPYQLLLEVGIEKVAKDYEQIFVEANICNANDLKLSTDQYMDDPVESNEPGKIRFTIRKTLFKFETEDDDDEVSSGIGFQNTKFKGKLIGKKLGKLGQTHLILEHLILAQNTFDLRNLNIEIFKLLSSRPRISLNDFLQMTSDSMKIIVSDKTQILIQFEDRNPTMRRISMKTDNKHSIVENVFYQSLEPIFPIHALKDEIDCGADR